jgi:hypothetical protein
MKGRDKKTLIIQPKALALSFTEALLNLERNHQVTKYLEVLNSCINITPIGSGINMADLTLATSSDPRYEAPELFNKIHLIKNYSGLWEDANNNGKSVYHQITDPNDTIPRSFDEDVLHLQAALEELSKPPFLTTKMKYLAKIIHSLVRMNVDIALILADPTRLSYIESHALSNLVKNMTQEKMRAIKEKLQNHLSPIILETISAFLMQDEQTLQNLVELNLETDPIYATWLMNQGIIFNNPEVTRAAFKTFILTANSIDILDAAASAFMRGNYKICEVFIIEDIWSHLDSNQIIALISTIINRSGTKTSKYLIEALWDYHPNLQNYLAEFFIDTIEGRIPTEEFRIEEHNISNLIHAFQFIPYQLMHSILNINSDRYPSKTIVKSLLILFNNLTDIKQQEFIKQNIARLAEILDDLNNTSKEEQKTLIPKNLNEINQKFINLIKVEKALHERNKVEQEQREELARLEAEKELKRQQLEDELIASEERHPPRQTLKKQGNKHKKPFQHDKGKLAAIPATKSLKQAKDTPEEDYNSAGSNDHDGNNGGGAVLAGSAAITPEYEAPAPEVPLTSTYRQRLEDRAADILRRIKAKKQEEDIPEEFSPPVAAIATPLLPTELQLEERQARLREEKEARTRENIRLEIIKQTEARDRKEAQKIENIQLESERQKKAQEKKALQVQVELTKLKALQLAQEEHYRVKAQELKTQQETLKRLTKQDLRSKNTQLENLKKLQASQEEIHRLNIEKLKAQSKALEQRTKHDLRSKSEQVKYFKAKAEQLYAQMQQQHEQQQQQDPMQNTYYGYQPPQDIYNYNNDWIQLDNTGTAAHPDIIFYNSMIGLYFNSTTRFYFNQDNQLFWMDQNGEFFPYIYNIRQRGEASSSATDTQALDSSPREDVSDQGSTEEKEEASDSASAASGDAQANNSPPQQDNCSNEETIPDIITVTIPQNHEQAERNIYIKPYLSDYNVIISAEEGLEDELLEEIEERQQQNVSIRYDDISHAPLKLLEEQKNSLNLTKGLENNLIESINMNSPIILLGLIGTNSGGDLFESSAKSY